MDKNNELGRRTAAFKAAEEALKKAEASGDKVAIKAAKIVRDDAHQALGRALIGDWS